MIDRTAIFKAFRAARLKAWALSLLAIFALLGALGFLVLPLLLKPVLIEKLSEALHRPVTIAQLSMNPYALSLRIDGLAVQESGSVGETTASLDRLFVDFSASSLWQGAPVVSEIRLENPKLRIVRLADKRYNVSDLIDALMHRPESDTPTPPFSVSNIQISGGSLAFDDRLLGEKHLLSELNLNLPFVSSLPYAAEIFVEPVCSAKIDGASLHLHARGKPFAHANLHDVHESELKLKFDHLSVAQYLDYLPWPAALNVSSGVLNGELKLLFRQSENKPLALVLSGWASLQDLRLADAVGAPLIALKQLDLALSSADFLQRQFVVERVVLDAPEIYLRRERQGGLNWLALLPKQAALEQASAAPPAPPISWSLGELKLNGGILHWLDESAAQRDQALRVDVERLDLSLANLSSAPGQTTQLSARFNPLRKDKVASAVALEGSMQLAPFDADLKLAVKALELAPLQSYVTVPLNIVLTRGQLTLDGTVRLHQASTGSAGLTGGLTGGFSGQATIGDFSAVDKIGSADFLKWKSLYLGALDFRLNPNALSIGEVALSDFSARAILDQDGKLNLSQIVRRSDSQPSTDKERMPIKIDQLTLQGGSVNFSDNFVQPHYSANLRQIGGRISGLSSVADSKASLELHGSYNRLAPLTIKGWINPLADEPGLDLQAEIKGLEMNTLSSYAGKYAGYAIEKGKLSLFAKYRLAKQRLEAENRLFLDQLTFGEPVASPEATKLPVLLAVALLKNRRGEIDIDLPIAGSLDDPQFSVGGLITKVIGKLLIKTLSAPFALLGSLFGGSADLSQIEFEPGRYALTPAAQQHLAHLAKALIERPALKLEIAGRADPENDRAGLKPVLLERKLRVLKRDDLTKQGVTPASLSEIKIGVEEYPVLLERAYRTEAFPKPRNLLGIVKTLPVEEMKKLMLSNSVIDDDDLRALALRRAREVNDWLLAHGVASERLFMLSAKLGVPAAESDAKTDKEAVREAVSGSRVDFSLR
jgi:uncharacterized protein involved in outer membrane biogenesis